MGDVNGLSWPYFSVGFIGEQVAVIEETDKKILRELAKSVAEIASRPEQDQKRKLWEKHNQLLETQPLVFCDPERAWYEILPATSLQCKGALARIWEFRLLKEKYWAEVIMDDRVCTSEFTIQYIFTETSRGKETQIVGGTGDGSYRWESCISDYNEVDELQFKQIAIDYQKTGCLLKLAQEVFNGILEVRLEGIYWWSLGMTADLILLRGFEQVLMDMYDNPAGLHKLMSFLRDENMAKLDFLEGNNLLSLNSLGDYVGTGGYGWTTELPSSEFDGKHVHLMDMWGYCESQETVSVSPDFFKEYVFPYQNSLLQRFGLNIYGCCEPLEKRWEVIRSIPRLRRVTVSPWSDPEYMAEILGKDYVYCRKINPAYMATKVMDEESARSQLRNTFYAAKKHGCPTEVMLRDVMTFSWNPENAVNWTRIAREEASRIYG
ncbi:MAG: hypothetical protein ACYCXK_11065 [Candidatus Humimicrobiaceae bacterium]